MTRSIHAVVDCGTTVHPDGALAQMEGSMLWGVSIALHEHTEISQGQVEGTNLHNYTPLRMADVPELDIQFIASEQPPTGLGEPGLIAVCPAIGNAIFNAVGVRLRSLPVKPEQIVEALAS
ncbi:MAG: molybdopterin-dependent oxidoreductase [Gammaproteobacteria bacterium]|nr:molybdopterin-dependent oxidoreductase [Gammaproteobacteria bacterium]